MNEYDDMGPVELDLMEELDYSEAMYAIHAGTRVSTMGDFVGAWD